MTTLTRRDLLKRGGAAGGALLLPLPLAAGASARPRTFRGGRFAEGVQSGDPTPTSITLLTRLRGVAGSGAVDLEVARDPGFRHVVAGGAVATDGSLAHAVKARVSRLQPHTQYWYRFSSRTADSPVGQFRTAPPPDSHAPIHFGVISGLEPSFGYFTALDLLAREDVDFVLNLGDYVYADRRQHGAAAVRTGPSPAVAVTLDDYRARYTRARHDRALRALHAAHPIVSCWDDGEVRTGYAGGVPAGAPNAAPTQAAAYRAWFEKMPHYAARAGTARTYGSWRFGRQLELLPLDVRQYRRPGTLLGSRQRHLAARRLHRSAARWLVLGTPVPLADVRAPGGALAGADGWQGYPGDKAELLQRIGNAAAGVVVLSGNLRRFRACNVTDGSGAVVAPELTTGSVSAPTDVELFAIAGASGWGTPDDPVWPADTQAATVLANAEAIYDDPLHHGYSLCTARRGSFTTTFHTVRSVRDKQSQAGPSTRFTVRHGQPDVALG